MTRGSSSAPDSTAFLFPGVRALYASTSGAGSLSPDVHRELCRRLAGVALCYTIGYAAAYGYSWIQTATEFALHRRAVADTIAVLSMALGLVVFAASRRGKLPPAPFANLAIAFEVLAAVGIMASAWGWELHFDDWQRHVFVSLGGSAGDYPEGFVRRMQAARERLIAYPGVTWVGIWVVVFPTIVPLSQRRTLFASILSAATVPAVMGASLLAHGVPASVRPWIGHALLDLTIPTLICAGLAFFSARVVYRLTHDLSRARQLGSYQLVERIGTGGMGEVWRARHRLLVRPAAIKLIRAESLGGDATAARAALRRFEREVQATAALRSPHTVEVYDFGIAADGAFYYVMELLDGMDLKTLVERFGPVPPERAAHLLRQVCHSLEDAHRRGLVHRDVKPANIFACRLGLDHDFVKVLDFGLVKELAVEAREATDLSGEGFAAGTPAFMAPEVATGTSPLDGRADLYSLGCVGYWLLTGRHVFEGPTPVATLLQHVRDEPAAPSRHAPAPVPPALDEILLACLRKDPNERPASAAAVAALLQRRGIAAAWTPERAAKWWEECAPVDATGAATS